MKTMMKADNLFEEIISLSLLAPGENGDGVPAMLWGDPGIAKTGRVIWMSEWYGMKGWVLSPGQHGHGLFGVVPVPKTIDGETFFTFPPPLKVLQFGDLHEGYGCVFMDEMTAVESRAVRPAMLGLLHGRCLGDFKFPAPTRVIAAGNPQRIAANGVDISIPEANRLCHIDTNIFQPTAAEVTAWRLQRGYRHTHKAALSPQELKARREERLYPIERKLEAEWDDMHAKTMGMWSGLCSPTRRGELLHAMPAPNNKSALKGWPSQRSWDMATSIYTTGKILGASSDAVNTMLEGCVGAAATEFLAYMRQSDLPDVKEWLQGRVKFEHDTVRPDRTYAVLDSAAQWVLAKGREKELQAFYQWMVAFDAKHPHDTEFLRFPLSTCKEAAKAASFPEYGKIMGRAGAVISTSMQGK